MSIYSNVSNIFGFNCTKCEYNRNCYGGNMGNQYKFCQKSREKLESLDKLEQENQKLKDRLNTYENPKDLTLMFMYCDEKAKDKIKCLEQENQQLKEHLHQKEDIIDKVIKWIENDYYSMNTTDIDTILITNDKLLQIRKFLKGDK